MMEKGKVRVKNCDNIIWEPMYQFGNILGNKHIGFSLQELGKVADPTLVYKIAAG